jgi:hypothetical protein
MSNIEKITQEELNQILSNIIELIENVPNNYDLGEKIRKFYYEKLKNIKEKKI